MPSPLRAVQNCSSTWRKIKKKFILEKVVLQFFSLIPDMCSLRILELQFSLRACSDQKSRSTHIFIVIQLKIILEWGVGWASWYYSVDYNVVNDCDVVYTADDTHSSSYLKISEKFWNLSCERWAVWCSLFQSIYGENPFRNISNVRYTLMS